MDRNQALDNRFTSPSGEKLSETMAKCTSVWSNGATKGYLIRAAQMGQTNPFSMLFFLRFYDNE